ncbi:hypothetical protein HW260_10475 [Helicobacter cinaedi]|uniref:Uncharacterized protein n=1 Tax=Helicobacter cinaedi CCUG 18818 = ATCC BAA-847 TaxID=537971 RepID=A0AAI8MR27_9HELI|nr:hypothetical protein [Helicobacter cinaedi]EFR46144.1 hypothetical protein HCCG_00690 [Helicobacter cinaedi CCUG 18818 = ATCC BAA-847]QOQ90621.1 hypothetical protein HW260_10475 [Helicobacter cinaedi]BAM33502.1 hypothetical protein HCBAA847_2287 [Helicobacter cinaedi CCUG 18818 = ATCC BAA-847]
MQNVNTESSLDSTSQTQGKAESNIKEPHNAISVKSKLANLPIALFASVMGIGGLSLVLKKQV